MKNPFSKFFTFLGKANSENGQPSNMRVIVMYSAFLFSTVLTFALAYVCFKYPDLILGLAAIVSGLFTSIIGLKAYQKGKEATASEAEKECAQ